MSIYVVTGKLGNGKSLLAVRKIQEALQAGRRVATNLDLTLEEMLPDTDRAANVIRLPDYPKRHDLEAIGQGAQILDESRYGLLVLDELATWMNARTWADKDRQGVIDWLIHSRKKRWDVILLIQHLDALDKQVRQALTEYLVTCKRFDRVPVPFVGLIGRVLSLGQWDGRIGRIHLGVVVYAAGSQNLAQALVVDRWLYRGNALFKAYDTEQVFAENYDRGPFSYLPPWQLVGRYRQAASLLQRIRVVLGLDREARSYPAKPVSLRPLEKLPPEARWRVTRRLVADGAL